MNDIQLFVVEREGIRPLPVPPNAKEFYELYDGMALGVYSALRTYEQNKFLWLDDHIQRMVNSMVLLGWHYQLDEDGLRRGLHEATSTYPFSEARVRFDVLEKPLQQYDSDSRVLIALQPFAGIPSHIYTEGVKVDFAEALQRTTPRAKTAVFSAARHVYTFDPQTAYERLLVDDAGNILECTSANFLGVRDGVVYTAGAGVLEGITLKIILALLEDLKIPVQYRPVHVDQIADLDEAGLCSSSRALIPIIEIGGQVVGNGRPGPICRQILAAYQAYVARAVKTAV